DVARVDLVRIDADDFPRDEARDLLEKIEQLDDQLARVRGDRAAADEVVQALGRLKPEAQTGDAMRPIPKLNPIGWQQLVDFAQAAWSKLQARERELDFKRGELERARAQLVERAKSIGGAARRGGWRVTPTVSGHGAADVTITYVVERARWKP